jgi:TrmH family RNA methyltransferase
MADKSHLVLVNPSNMGNMGTILRSCLAFGIHDVAIISPAPDIMNPKVIRSSMGAIFSLRIKYYDSFDEYRKLYQKHEVFTFMLDGKKPLSAADAPKPELYSLVFGNEATGLPEEFLHKGTSVIIPESPEVDSLNITIAVGIGLFLFSQGKF